jgi:hypothetical protein
LFAISMFRRVALVSAVQSIIPELLPAGWQPCDLDAVIAGLVARRLVQTTTVERELMEHPLVREHFYKQLL